MAAAAAAFPLSVSTSKLDTKTREVEPYSHPTLLPLTLPPPNTFFLLRLLHSDGEEEEEGDEEGGCEESVGPGGSGMEVEEEEEEEGTAAQVRLERGWDGL